MANADAAERLESIRTRIDKAQRRFGPPPERVELVAVSKTFSANEIAPFLEAGQRVFGENRVQEAASKRVELPAECEWHLLGPLQSNKVRQAVDLFATFHAVDRPKIAHALAAEAQRRGVELQGFVEVNLGGEASKHGFPSADLVAALAPFRALPGLQLVGLMAIPPPGADAEASRPWFRQLRALRDELAASPGWGSFPGWLSMGMSDDFAVAVEEGATHVRVGTALFGPRG